MKSSKLERKKITQKYKAVFLSKSLSSSLNLNHGLTKLLWGHSLHGSTAKRHSVASLGGPTPAALQAEILNWYSVPSMSFSTVYCRPFTAGLVTGARLTRPQYTAPRSLFSSQYPWMVEPPLSRGGSQVTVIVVAVAAIIFALRGGPGRPNGSRSWTFSESQPSLIPYLFSALILNW